MPQYVLIANPGTPRCETYRREFDAFWGGHADLVVVPWADIVARDGDLDDLPAFDRPAVVRLESPGKCDDVYRRMLAVGAREDPAAPPQDWLAEDLPKGRILRPGLWYRGFRRILTGLRRSFDARPHLAPTACPLAVAEMFDKNATLAKLAAAGVPVPEWVPPDQLPDTGKALYHRIDEIDWPRTYVKLNTGSSAIGIVAVDVPRNGPPRGTTTVAFRGGRAFNTRRLRRVEGNDLVATLEFLCAEGVTVQRGVPMARLDDQNFDVRVVCVAGKPVASVLRVSPHPMTNLYLGGRRGDEVRCRAAIPTRAWLDALDDCAAAAGCFDSRVAGVDLVFEPGFRRHAVLEVNAFGDFFPGWVDGTGRSIHALGMAVTTGRVH
jgi:hypothetical protein